MNCYYDAPGICTDELWKCLTCGEWFCSAHNHITNLGENVECVACERTRGLTPMAETCPKTGLRCNQSNKNWCICKAVNDKGREWIEERGVGHLFPQNHEWKGTDFQCIPKVCPHCKTKTMFNPERNDNTCWMCGGVLALTTLEMFEHEL